MKILLKKNEADPDMVEAWCTFAGGGESLMAVIHIDNFLYSSDPIDNILNKDEIKINLKVIDDE